MESRLRTSQDQFSILLDFMERHGDLSKPHVGPQGRIKNEQLWIKLSNSLNSLGGGVQKTSDKWKKVWADWKTKTKKKYLTIRLHANRTGGGPQSKIALSALEERLMAVIGVTAVMGQSGIAEQGFSRTSGESVDVQLTMGHSNALEDPSQSGHTSTNYAIATPGPSRVFAHNTISDGAPTPLTLPSARQTPLLVPRTPPLAPLTPPCAQPTQTPPPLEPPGVRTPLHNNEQQASDSVQSPPATPRRALLRARRNRGLTPFERAAQEYTAVEQRRLVREDARELRRLEYEEARDRRLHEREMEKLRLEEQRIQVSQQQNELLHQLGVLAQHLIDVITQQGRSGSLPSTDPQ